MFLHNTKAISSSSNNCKTKSIQNIQKVGPCVSWYRHVPALPCMRSLMSALLNWSSFRPATWDPSAGGGQPPDPTQPVPHEERRPWGTAGGGKWDLQLYVTYNKFGVKNNFIKQWSDWETVSRKKYPSLSFHPEWVAACSKGWSKVHLIQACLFLWRLNEGAQVPSTLCIV